jgi:shikimate dehydrogenase
MSTTPIKPSISSVFDAANVYLMLGDSEQNCWATELFNPIFAGAGLDAVLAPVQVEPGQVGTFIKTALEVKNIKGLWVAAAHQSAAMAVLDDCSSLARIAGAVNAIRRNADGRLEGALFDGVGFVASLIYFGISYANQSVLILGAGGTAAAIAASLAQPADAVCAAEVALYDPDRVRAARLAERIAAATGTPVRAASSSDPAGFDLVVNVATPGLHAGDSLPCDMARMQSHACVLDMVLQNQPTALLRAARARGLQAQPGFEMRIQQAHLYLDFFGFTQVAGLLRRDASVQRQQLYPQALQHEIHPQLPSDSQFSPFTFSSLS